MHKIIKKEKLADDLYAIQINAPEIASHISAGQYVAIRLDENSERTPLYVADFDKKKLTIVFESKPKKNPDLAKLRKGDSLTDFSGPLGMSCQIMDKKFVCITASGEGIAAIVPIAKSYRERGIRLHIIIHGKNKKHIYWKDVLAKLCEKLIIATDDGSVGVRSNINNLLTEIHRKHRYDLVISIGPTIFMRDVSKYTYQRIKTLIYLHPSVVDSYGQHSSARIRYDGKLIFTCEAGLEIDAHLVEFSDLLDLENPKLQEENLLCKIANAKSTKKK